MDAAYYEDLAGRLYGLVIRLSDRLPAEQVQWLHHVTEAGEYGLALEDMAAMLIHAQVAITYAIGTLAGAYFGYHAGSAGKTAADQERRAAESARHAEAEKTQRLAVLAHETHADKVEKILGM